MICNFGCGGRADIFSFCSKVEDEKLVVTVLKFDYHVALEKTGCMVQSNIIYYKLLKMLC